MGTSSPCHNEDMDDVNETIDLDHDIEGLEEVPRKGRLGIRTIPCVLW